MWPSRLHPRYIKRRIVFMEALELEIVHKQQNNVRSIFARTNMKLQISLPHHLMGLCRTLPHRLPGLRLTVHHQARLPHQEWPQLLREWNRPYLWKAFCCISHFFSIFAFLFNFDIVAQYVLWGKWQELNCAGVISLPNKSSNSR